MLKIENHCCDCAVDRVAQTEESRCIIAISAETNSIVTIFTKTITDMNSASFAEKNRRIKKCQKH